MKTHQQFTIALFLILSSIGLLWFTQEEPNKNSALAHAKPLTLNWKAGISQFYRLKMNSSMRLDLLGPGQAQDINVKLRSQLELHTLQANKEKAIVGFKLSRLELSISGQADAEMNQMLEKPFRVHFLSGAVPERFEFPEGLTQQEQTMLKNIVRTFTVSTPISDDEPTWIASEKNASGAYRAYYQKISPTIITKKKQNFVASKKSAALDKAVIHSTEKIEINYEHNWLIRMTISETLQTAGNKKPSVNIKNIAELELLKSKQVQGHAQQWEFIAATPLPAPTKQQAGSRKLSAAEARQQLIAELPRLDATNKGRSKRIHALRDLLRSDGSIPALLLEQMQTQDISDRTRADLYLALELASTPAAQSALTSVISGHEWSLRDAMRATVALAGIANPSQETLTVLWDTAFNGHGQLATTATFTLGSMASQMKAIDNPSYTGLRDELLSNAYGSSNAQQRADFIYALGNTRDPEIAHDVSTFLGDEQVEVRRAAALSLGLMQTEQSSEVLLEHFTQENTSAVRGAIAESLNTLPLADKSSAMVLISSAIHEEKDESARYAMANFMGANLAQHPEYKATLQKLLRQEPSKRVRQTIADALATR